MADRDPETFAEVKTRLDEIVEAVSDDNLSLDDALSLYEEAVSLGLRASDLLEADIDAESASEEADDSIQGSKTDDAESASVEALDSVQSLKTSSESSDSVQSLKTSSESSDSVQSLKASAEALDSVQNLKEPESVSAESSDNASVPTASSRVQENAAHVAAENFA